MTESSPKKLEQAKARFDAAETPISAADRLQLDAMYAQATQGDIQGKRPGFTDFAERMRYDAWARLQGKTKEAAAQAYIEQVNKLQ